MSLEDAGDRRQMRALSHPLRVRILSLTSGAAMSTAELARELGMNHAAVSYHVRKLVAAGFLTLAETRSVRGGQERRYRHQTGGPAQWDDEEARLAVRAASAEVLRRLAELPSVSWRLFADAELWVDPAVWAAVSDQIAAAVRELHAAALAPHAAGAVQVSATAVLFTGGRGAGRGEDGRSEDGQDAADTQENQE
jgi:DNA-binding transcriptional ArsR family regulator